MRNFLHSIPSIVVAMASIFILAIAACKKDENKVDFDREVMLQNIGENLVVPAYDSLKIEVGQLSASTAAFTANPDSIQLAELQQAWKNALLAWQKASAYELGPAEQEVLRSSLNTFPTDTIQIQSNVQSGTYNLGTADNIDAKGFPALDYLLFGLAESNALILNQYTTDSSAANRKAYLEALVSEIKTKTDAVAQAWSPTGGNYLATFISKNGTDIGSSTGQLVNQLNFDLEIIKNAKIGIPLGKKTLGTPMPEKVEGYYSGMSVIFASEQLKALENIYLGRDLSGSEGKGFDDYLEALDAKHNGNPLNTTIKTQFTSARQALNAVPDPLAGTILTNPAIVDKAYVEIQKLVVLLKSDMPAALGVSITYQDNDGD